MKSVVGAIVGRDYQMSTIQTTDGRLLTGIVKEETQSAVHVQTANELVVVPRDEIALRELSPVSMMPEDMLPRLTVDVARNLVHYLQGAEQAPLPATAAK